MRCKNGVDECGETFASRSDTMVALHLGYCRACFDEKFYVQDGLAFHRSVDPPKAKP